MDWEAVQCHASVMLRISDYSAYLPNTMRAKGGLVSPTVLTVRNFLTSRQRDTSEISVFL